MAFLQDLELNKKQVSMTRCIESQITDKIMVPRLVQEEEITEIQEHRNTRTQKYKNTEIQETRARCTVGSDAGCRSRGPSLIFDMRSSIVKSVLDCHLAGVIWTLVRSFGKETSYQYLLII